jgi:hypothetical protein
MLVTGRRVKVRRGCNACAASTRLLPNKHLRVHGEPETWALFVLVSLITRSCVMSGNPVMLARWAAVVLATSLAAACSSSDAPTTPPADGESAGLTESGLALDLIEPGQTLPFTPVASSATCRVGGAGEQVLLPPGFIASTIAGEAEPSYPNNADMNTVNESGVQQGRFLYRTHELGDNAGVSVTDLSTGETHIVARRADWERFDGIAWTPWGTILAAEEVTTSVLKDPELPNAKAGHVYEIDPQTGSATLLAAVGSRSHEGLRFDAEGNLYGISENSPGYIYRFVPTKAGDLTAGDLYVLRIVERIGDRTGWAEWVKLDPDAVTLDSDAAAAAVQATGYGRPEDVETGASTGDDRRGNRMLYVAVTTEARVLAVDLHPNGVGPERKGQVFVSDYVKAGVNAPSDFTFPDNLALDQSGNLFITEDPGGNASEGKTLGDDVWFAPFNTGSSAQSLPAQRFLSITDCEAEPTGVYLSRSGKTLFVNIQHRGGDWQDLTLGIQRLAEVQFRSTSKGALQP